MTGWGNKRVYNVSKVRMDLTPSNTTFDCDGHQMSVMKYFKDKYNIDLEET